MLVDGVQDYAIFALDVDGLVTTWNEGAQRIKGYRASDIIGRHFSVFYPREDLLAGIPEAELAAAVADGSAQAEGWRVRQDGSRFWASVVITAVFDDDHRLRGFAKVTRDITERRAADQAARDSEERVRAAEFEARLAAMVEFSEDAIWSFALEGNITSWNGGATRLYGYTAEEMVGRNVLSVGDDSLLAGGWIPLSKGSELPGILRRVAGGERMGHFETQRLSKDRAMVDVSLTVSPLRDAGGVLTGMSVVGRDITERKRLDGVAEIERRRLRAAESIGRIGWWEVDGASLTIVWSDTLLALYGLQREDFDRITRRRRNGSSTPTTEPRSRLRSRPAWEVRRPSGSATG